MSILALMYTARTIGGTLVVFRATPPPLIAMATAHQILRDGIKNSQIAVVPLVTGPLVFLISRSQQLPKPKVFGHGSIAILNSKATMVLMPIPQIANRIITMT